MEFLTSLFREITEPLHRKQDTTICGEMACVVPLLSALPKYIQTSSTNILVTAFCLVLQLAHAVKKITK